MGMSSEGWKQFELGQVLTLQRGFDLPHRLRREGTVPVVSSSGVSGRHSESQVTAPGIVTGRYGTIGEVFYIEEDFWPLNTTLYVRDFKGNNPLFLSYILRTIDFQSHSGKSGVPGVNRNDLHRLTVRLPVPEEQRVIAEALADVDGSIESINRLIIKKRAVKQAVTQQLLTGKTRLPGFSKEWKVCTIGDIGLFSKGRGIKRDDVSDDGVACIRYGELYTRYKDYIITPVSRIPQEIALTAQQVETGDLLFAGSGETAEEIGRCAAYIGEEKVYAGGDIIILKPTGQNSLYLGYLMNHETVAAQKARLGQGDAVVHISSRSLARIAIVLPPLDEQNAIATVLFDMDDEIAALERRLEKTKAIKQGMMQELLAGKIRLLKHNVFTSHSASAPQEAKAPNWQINEAVVISILAKQFGTEQYPLGRKRYTKLSYLLHRCVGERTDGYLKKAAGPYNPKTKYGGPEKIAIQNAYVRELRTEQFQGFIAGDNIAQAEGYFDKWYGSEVRDWLEQFRYTKNDELELLATVDMAAEELRGKGAEVTVAAIKDVIHADQEWKAKLSREVFSDSNIAKAIETCRMLLTPSSKSTV